MFSCREKVKMWLGGGMAAFLLCLRWGGQHSWRETLRTSRPTKRTGTTAGGAPALQIRRQHGDRVPVSEPWMPPTGGTLWQQGERRRAGRRGGSLRPTKVRGKKDTPPLFCETKPFVMLANGAVSYCDGVFYVDYRKMTNGFVLGEFGRVGRRVTDGKSGCNWMAMS